MKTVVIEGTPPTLIWIYACARLMATLRRSVAEWEYRFTSY